MKTTFLLLLTAISLFSFSCTVTPERKPATAKGSEDGVMPWNIPGANEGQGGFGGSLSR